MSYTTINGMRSARYPLQGMGLGPVIATTPEWKEWKERRTRRRRSRLPFAQRQFVMPPTWPVGGCVGCGPMGQAENGAKKTGPLIAAILVMGAGMYLYTRKRKPTRNRRRRRR